MARNNAHQPADRPLEHHVTVIETFRVTPSIRRIVFASEGLATAFATPAGAHAPYLKLVLGGSDRPVVRTYSIRYLNPGRDELHVDFVLHANEGPGSAFGRSARPGSTVRLRGPGHLAITQPSHYYLAADHCGLPALCHLLENLPQHAAGSAVLEVPDDTEILPLRGPTAIQVEWLVRPSGAPSRLPECFAAFREPMSKDSLVWAGAEANISRRVRSIAKETWRVPTERCQVLNYWRQGRPEGSFSFMS